MNLKKKSRLRRALGTRLKLRELGAVRLCVYRSSKHIYAQIISSNGSAILACASSLDKEINEFGGNVIAATKVGNLIAVRAKTIGISKVSFDRSGFKYHGRVKALADAARENGLEF